MPFHAKTLGKDWGLPAMPMDHHEEIQKIQRLSMVDQVYNILKDQIRQGKYAASEKLQPEGELAKIFGVNRLTVRMALQKLSAVGIVETFAGDGTYVCQPSLNPLLNEIQDFYNTPERLHDVTAMRNLLEVASVRNAVEKGTQEELELIHRRLLRYNECLQRYWEDIDNHELLNVLVEADLKFHRQIVQVSHNQLYLDIYDMLQKLIYSNISDLLSLRIHQTKKLGKNPGSGILDQHDSLYQAIRKRDLEAALAICQMIIHVIPIPELDSEDSGTTN